jgi:acetoacetyl-CoA synthetase
MFARLEGLFRLPLPVMLLFRAPSVRELAHEIEYFTPSKPGPHVFTFRAEGTRPPLFVMPSMAGTVLHWREFVGAFPGDRPMCGIYMAGEPDYAQEATFEHLARQCAEAIAEAYPDRPYHLCGYSFGGMLAFEVARQLTLLGRQVGTVAVIDSGPASMIANNLGEILRHSWPILKNLGARACQAGAARQWRQGLRAVIAKLQLIRGNRAPKGANRERHVEEMAFEYLFGHREMPDRIRRLVSWGLKLQMAYRPRPYQGTVLLLRASKRPLLGPFERDLGWGPFVNGGLVVADFPGDHRQMIAEAPLRTIAGLLTDSFEKFEAARGPAIIPHRSTVRPPHSPGILPGLPSDRVKV